MRGSGSGVGSQALVSFVIFSLFVLEEKSKSIVVNVTLIRKMLSFLHKVILMLMWQTLVMSPKYSILTWQHVGSLCVAVVCKYSIILKFLLGVNSRGYL